VVDIRMPPTHTDEGLRPPSSCAAATPAPGCWCSPSTSRPGTRPGLLAPSAAGVGYLLKDRVADVAEFADALARVAAGGTALDPEVVGQLLGAGRHARGLAALTPREREVLA
jgi:DNA-binding NarL/FixJ family response regulator